MTRQYSLKEIDKMRSALADHLRLKITFVDKQAGAHGIQFGDVPWNEVEKRLQTYMIAGVDPDELVQHLAKRP